MVRLELTRLYKVSDAGIKIWNKLAIPGETHHAGNEALSDAVGQVDTVRLAPLGNHVSVTDDDPCRFTSVLERAEWLRERLSSELTRPVCAEEVPWHCAFHGPGERNG